MLYTVPTFQNPTGSVMSAARRRHIGRLAAAHHFVVVDDDPYRRLGLAAAPPRLREFVPDDLAVSVGSFSKCVAPGLRVGWVHGPRWLVDALVRLKQSADLHTNTIGQRALVELLGRDGWLEEHTGRVARTLHRRGEVLAEELTSAAGALVQVEPPAGGMFLWARFSPEVGDTDLLARDALADGVAIVAGSVFDPLGRPSSGARLGFASSDEAELRVGARRLARTVLRRAGAGMARSSATPQS
jgi:DNA-binding transcriptional MocR family regulator